MAARRIIARERTHHTGTFAQRRRCRSAQLAFWDRYVVFHSDLHPLEPKISSFQTLKFYLHPTLYRKTTSFRFTFQEETQLLSAIKRAIPIPVESLVIDELWLFFIGEGWSSGPQVQAQQRRGTPNHLATTSPYYPEAIGVLLVY